MGVRTNGDWQSAVYFYIISVTVLVQLSTPSACSDNGENKYSMYQYLAVAHKGVLEFVDASGNLTANVTEPFNKLYAMAYDPRDERIYLTDSEHQNTSIFQIDVTTQTVVPLVAKTNEDKIRGIAYDPGNNALYWTSSRAITMINIDGVPKPSVIVEFKTGDNPRGIAVDHCKGFLYWTNTRYGSPSIGRSKLDGSESQVLVNTDLYEPLSIAVDQWTDKLYWTDDTEGQYYRIESSNLDGSGRRTVLSDSHHRPLSLAIGKDTIYWSDAHNFKVWALPKKGGKPTTLRAYGRDPPLGIVARISTECPNHDSEAITTDHMDYLKDSVTTISPFSHCDESVAYCLNGGTFNEDTKKCQCASGSSGMRCEVSACYNFCIHGLCYLDSTGNAQCECQIGYKGQRCHLDVCEGYCLNGGRCNVRLGGEPICECGQSEGQRCQIERDFSNLHSNVTEAASRRDCSFLEVYRIALFALAAMLAIATIVIGLLVRKVMKLSKRPRIRKQIIVKKNVTPLTSRPQQGEQCEITIENCCNMNICETPCFEPQLRTSKSKSKKEEKKNLLGNMGEPSQEDLY